MNMTLHCFSLPRITPKVHAFGEVIRRVWSPSNFKSAVSPHEFIQAVSYASKKRFRPGVQAEAVDFLSWLLNSLHQVRLANHPPSAF